MEGLTYSRCERHNTRLIGELDTCSYCDAIMSERRRIVTVLELDVLLKDKTTSDRWLERATQLIMKEER